MCICKVCICQELLALRSLDFKPDFGGLNQLYGYPTSPSPSESILLVLVNNCLNAFEVPNKLDSQISSVLGQSWILRPLLILLFYYTHCSIIKNAHLLHVAPVYIIHVMNINSTNHDQNE